MNYVPGEQRVRRPDGIMLFHTEAALNIPGAVVMTADENGELQAPVPAVPVPPTVGPRDVDEAFAALPPADVDDEPELVPAVDTAPASVNVPTHERVAEIEAAVEAAKPKRGRPAKVAVAADVDADTDSVAE